MNEGMSIHTEGHAELQGAIWLKARQRHPCENMTSQERLGDSLARRDNVPTVPMTLATTPLYSRIAVCPPCAASVPVRCTQPCWNNQEAGCWEKTGDSSTWMEHTVTAGDYSIH